jgi:hypothetical protein
MSVTVFRQSQHRRAIVRASVQRSRERVRKCQAQGKFRYDGRLIDVLIKRRYIDEREVGSATAINEAVTVLLADLVAADQP